MIRKLEFGHYFIAAQDLDNHATALALQASKLGILQADDGPPIRGGATTDAVACTAGMCVPTAREFSN
jgi:hypothetical protein